MRRLLLLLAVFAVCAGCDQATKSMARSCLSQGEIHSYLHDTFRLQLTFNRGAFLGLGTSLGNKWRAGLLIGGTGCLLVGLLGYALIVNTIRRSALVAVALILAGGFSNLADRIIFDGQVVDFMNLGIGSLRSGIFNVADLVIMAGVILWAGQTLGSRSGGIPGG